ncbi:4-hydroxymandelate oxidase [Nonomuraea polychroma]|uniref:4-hydroxymandelate oxidase n=1 Tax=Nonomuraea polychroma TaxID=46176 RepID=A0A438M3L4_9ACTN|nr:alpha-hydroxy acid oxidase [Nonomuraea polychroma]RVX40043.1 4-hydroxymandelate oxidase [Nonomuraea polychroma]
MTHPSAATTHYETLADIEAAALESLPLDVHDYLEGGAGEEWTLRRNREAFAEWGFAPRLMSSRQAPGLRTTFMGVPLGIPILTGPFGVDTLFHPEGQKAVARAAARSGTSGMAPEGGSYSYAEVRRAAPGGMAFGQLHPVGPEDAFTRRLKHFEGCGFRALVVTCDTPTAGWRERNRRNGYTPPHAVTGGNFAGDEGTGDAFADLFGGSGPAWTWEKLRRLMSGTSLPWMAKGITTVPDAEAAIAAGASAIGVSNHGGRQLDGLPAALDALPEIAGAVGDRAHIAFDSGVRRGSDVVKALALGADVVVLGRLAVYGLIAGGEAGVARVLDLLRQEVVNILTLLGCAGLNDLDRGFLRRH